MQSEFLLEDHRFEISHAALRGIEEDTPSWESSGEKEKHHVFNNNFGRLQDYW